MPEVKFKKSLKGEEYVVYNCPNCDASLNSPIDEIGIRDTCPECDKPFIVPGVEQLEARRTAAKLKKEEAEAEALLRKQKSEAKNSTASLSSATPVPPRSTSNQTQEHELYFSKKAMFAAHPFLFLLSIILIALYGLGLIILILWYIDCHGSSLTITNKRSILRSGILAKHTSEVLHRDVRNLQVSQGIINRLFGVGSIGISSSGQSDFEIFIRGISNPYKAKSVIDDVRLN